MEREPHKKLHLQPITTFIPKSQSKKYQVQNIQIYESGEIKNITSPSSLELSEFQTLLKDFLPKGRISTKGPTFRNKKALNITQLIQEYVKNIQGSKEVFLGNFYLGKNDNYHNYHNYSIDLGEEIAGRIEDRQDSISLNSFYKLKQLKEEEYSFSWTPKEIIQGYKIGNDQKRVHLSNFLVNQSLTLEMDIYVALPFSENFLGNNPQSSHSSHSDFLKNFQEQYEVERPWRYTCVKNWLLIPRFSLDGKSFFDINEITDYARTLRYEVWKLSENGNTFQSIERMYAYLQFVRDFTSKDYILQNPHLKIHDQIQFQLAQEYEPEDIENLIETLGGFFASSIAYVNALTLDLKALAYIKSRKARLDASFVEQSLETIRYLLKKHKLDDNVDSLEKYVEEHSQSYLPFTPQEILFPLSLESEI